MTDHAPLTTTPLPVRLRTEDFFRLDAAGAFTGYGKTELIRGEIFYMNAQHRPHARMKMALYDEFRRWITATRPPFDVIAEATVAMPPHSAPEPDLVLTSEPDGDGPVPLASVRLLVEIADSTLGNDLGTKAALYAEQGVPEYWVVDLAGERVIRMWEPAGGAYAGRQAVAFGEVRAETVAGLVVRVASR